MTRFLTYAGADKALRSNCWIVTSKTPQIRGTERIGSCLGQNLYILLVFSQRIPYVVYSFVLIFSSVSVTSNYPFEKNGYRKRSKFAPL